MDTSGHSPNEKSSTAVPACRLSGRLRRYLLFFLEAIGLKREREPDRSAQLARLRLYHTQFRKLLSANNSFLETLGELENKRQGREYVDRALIRGKVIRMIADVHAMVESLNTISQDRYPVLPERLDGIVAHLGAEMEESAGASSVLVMDVPHIMQEHACLVGGKMANLGELRNMLGLPTPDGLAITTACYRLLLEKGGVRSWVQDRHVSPIPPGEVETASEELQQRILGLRLPGELAGEIRRAFERFCARTEGDRRVAVRSSAVGEDGDFSFAGQFASILNVAGEELLNAYLRVLASLYSAEAVRYRLLHGIPGDSAEMAVGVVEMIDAQASGVVFSIDPDKPDSGEILIQAVKGLGAPLVDGRVSPEAVFVPRKENGRPYVRHSSRQSLRVEPAPDGGIAEVPLSPEDAALPCISDEEAARLARWALMIEAHFGGPQDIEWTMDKKRRLFILQARPLRLPPEHVTAVQPLAGYQLLLGGGEIACPGVGTGPAVHVDPDGDMDAFPEGGVLVARRSSPRFVHLMSRARAIITDTGGTAGHMASLAREFRVPALLNTGVATRAIPEGMVVTVDANGGFVYAGEVPELFGQNDDRRECRSPVWRNPDFRLLENVLRYISPLYLSDPGAASFTALNCRTLHDLARFIHEKSYREMFLLGENVGDLRAVSFCLDVFLPVDLYIIDLGGGVRDGLRGPRVKPSQITSVPLSAVIRGMLREGLSRFGPKPMDMRGLFSVVMRHALTSPEEEQSFREPSYALASDCYLNYAARVGYHFSVVDAYCSGTPNKNYISLLFRGGAADYTRRNRRVRAIGGILKEYGFSVDLAGDTVSARLSKTSAGETAGQLEMIGSLFQFFRQMDAAMADEQSVLTLKDAFLGGDYGLRQVKGD